MAPFVDPNGPLITKVELASAPGTNTPSWKVSWTSPQNDRPVSLFLTESSGSIVKVEPNLRNSPSSLTASSALRPNEYYYLQIGKADNPQPRGDVPALWRRITDLRATFDGAQLEVQWENPTPLPEGVVIGNQLTLTGTDGTDLQTFYYLNTADQPSLRRVTFQPRIAIRPAGTYTLTNRLVALQTTVFPPSLREVTSLGPLSASIALLTFAPPVLYVDNTGSGPVTVATPSSGRDLPATYQLTTYLNGGLVEVADLAAQRLAVDGESFFGVQTDAAPRLVGQDVSFTLRETAQSGLGPEGAPGSMLMRPPELESVAVNATGDDTVTLTVAFAPGPIAATGAQATVVDSAGTSFTQSFLGTSGTIELPQAATPPYELTVRSMLGLSLGPPSKSALPVPTSPVTLRAADWDGRLLRAAWNESGDSGVTGYRLQLFDGQQSVAQADFGGTSGSFAADVAPDRHYQVRAQSLAPSATGPLGPPLSIPPHAWYLWPETKDAPTLLPVPAGATIAPSALQGFLPQLYSSPPTTLPSTTSFTLEAVSGHPGFPYSLRFRTGNAVWQFSDEAGRLALQQEYTQFLSMLEGLEPSQPPDTVGTLAPGAIPIVQEAIARLIPQTFDETLYYNYGVRAFFGAGNNRMVDLRRGQRVRIDFEAFQNLGADPPQYLNGYVGRGAGSFEVVGSTAPTGSPDPGFTLGFGAFLARLTDLQVPDPDSSSTRESGAGGAVDFFASSLRAPFYRVIYPTRFPVSDGPGSAAPDRNVTVLAAQSWTTLESVTEQLLGGASVPVSGSRYALAYLRGRAVVTPLIRISWRGEERWLPVGTTLRQLLEEDAAAPLAITTTPANLSLLRATGTAVLDPAAYVSALQPGAGWPVRLAGQVNAVYATGRDAFDLPLLHGDRIEI